MLRMTRRRIIVALLMAAPLVGTTFAPGCLETALLAANPCGTVLNCPPETWYAVISATLSRGERPLGFFHAR